MDIGVSSTPIVCRAAVVETFRKHLLTDGAYKFSDMLKQQANEICGLIEDGDMMLTLRKATGYVNTMLAHHKILIVK